MIGSVLLDNSFCLRLVDPQNEYHQNVREYFEYFKSQKILMYLSSITVAEYSVRNRLQDFPLQEVRQIVFDVRDGIKAGQIWDFVHREKLGKNSGNSRDAVKDDCKLFAQICNRKIDAFISKDRKAYNTYVLPIQNSQVLDCRFDFIDLTNPRSQYLGQLF